MSEEAIKRMPGSIFKALVKKQSIQTAIKYVKEKKKKKVYWKKSLILNIRH